MSRYMEASQEVIDKMDSIIEEWFPEIASANIKVLMDSKKRKSKGSYTVASIKKMNPKEKYLSADNIHPDGFDYLLTIDSNIWDNIPDADKTRLIRHELRHVYIDNEAKDPYKTVDHDVQEFREEIKLNSDDPDWDLRVLDIAASIYEDK